ncbi:MAG: hypothetical protein ACI84B_001605, partial [Oceanospirillaceae bacterium]
QHTSLVPIGSFLTWHQVKIGSSNYAVPRLARVG